VSREYRQFCGLARALEIVGGRWTLLIVRDLLSGPKRFTELQEGLPGIPTNVLTARLRELEEAGVVGRRLLPRAVGYELTDYGRDLEGALVHLGLWGARNMGVRRDDDFFSLHALSLALRGAFRPEKRQDRDNVYELRINDEALRVSIAEGKASFGSETDKSPDVVIETDPDGLYQLLTGMLSIDKAVATARVHITGSIRNARRFFDVFRLAPPIETQMPPG
jgi:DNA-binding HxlR family transcriptional regulator/putative sterol carrier protein